MDVYNGKGHGFMAKRIVVQDVYKNMNEQKKKEAIRTYMIRMIQSLQEKETGV